MQTLLRHDLIDEYRVAVHPIVLGSGTRLFPHNGVSATLQLTGTHTLDSGVVNLTYRALAVPRQTAPPVS